MEIWNRYFQETMSGEDKKVLLILHDSMRSVTLRINIVIRHCNFFQFSAVNWHCRYSYFKLYLMSRKWMNQAILITKIITSNSCIFLNRRTGSLLHFYCQPLGGLFKVSSKRSNLRLYARCLFEFLCYFQFRWNAIVPLTQHAPKSSL